MEGPNPVSVNKDDSGPLPEFITITMSTLGDTEEACIIRKTILELRLMVWETLAQQLVFTLFGAPIDLDCVRSRIENNFDDTVFHLVTLNLTFFNLGGHFH